MLLVFFEELVNISLFVSFNNLQLLQCIFFVVLVLTEKS